MPRILGIDPGLNTTGYAVVDFFVDAQQQNKIVEAGVVRSSRKGSLSTRLGEIFGGIQEIVQQFSPEQVALEDLYSHYKQPQTAIIMGHARGVICLAAQQAELEVVAYSATQIKKIITGSGHAAKWQIQEAIKREFKLKKTPEPNDVADALAIAVCHGYLSRSL